MMQQLLDTLKTAEKAYRADGGQETYNVLRNAAVCLYRAIWDSLVDGNTIHITGESYYHEHEIKPSYTETIRISDTGYLYYLDSHRVGHNFNLSAADKVEVLCAN